MDLIKTDLVHLLLRVKALGNGIDDFGQIRQRWET